MGWFDMNRTQVDIEGAKNACLAAIKAVQNMRAARAAFSALVKLIDSDDTLALEAYFLFAVIRYARPFTSTKIPGGTVVYPIRHLQKMAEFNMDLHKQLIELRNTLVAHDDITVLEPKILTIGISPSDIDFHIPTSVIISNKCLGHPSNLAAAQKIESHVKAAEIGTINHISEVLADFRKVILGNPNYAEGSRKYSRHLGQFQILASGTQLPGFHVTDEPFLSVNEPNFSAIIGGFRYEEFQVRRDFHGPEKINLPDGRSIVINPGTKDAIQSN